MQQIPTPPGSIISPEEMQKLLPSGSSGVLSPEDMVKALGSAQTTQPKERSLLSRGMDWLYNKVILPPPPVNGVPAPPREHNWQIDPKSVESAPETLAMLATLPAGGGGAAAARPVVGAVRAGLGSLAGSAMKEGGALWNNTEGFRDAAWNAGVSALENMVPQYVGERIFSGALRPAPGTAGAARVEAFNKEFPKLKGSPAVSASAILGDHGNVTSDVLRSAQEVSDTMFGGSQVAKKADTATRDALVSKMRQNTGELPLAPLEDVGTSVQTRLRDDVATRKAYTADSAAANKNYLEMERKAAETRIQNKLDAVKQQYDGVTAELPQGWSSGASTSGIMPPPKLSASHPVVQQAEALAAQQRAAADVLLDNKLSQLPNGKFKVPPAEANTIRPLLSKDPEFVVDTVGRKNITGMKKVVSILADSPKDSKAFADRWMDTHIFSGDSATLMDRVHEAQDSGVLKTLYPNAERMVGRLESLAGIVKDTQTPTPSYGNALRFGQAVATAASLGAAATGHLNPGTGLTVAMGSAGLSSVVSSVLRTPVTRRILLDGLMDPNAARGALTAARAVTLAKALQNSNSGRPSITPPPEPIR